MTIRFMILRDAAARLGGAAASWARAVMTRLSMMWQLYALHRSVTFIEGNGKAWPRKSPWQALTMAIRQSRS